MTAGAPSTRRSPLARLGGWAGRHRFVVVIAWVALLVVATGAHHEVGSEYSDTLSIPGSPAQQGLDSLKAHDPSAGGQGGQVVFVDARGSVASQRSAIEASRSNVSRLAHVLSVSDPLSRSTVSSDGGTAYATIDFSANPQDLGSAYLNEIDQAVAPARRAGVQVDYGGTLGQAAAPKGGDAKSEVIGIVVAIVVLLIAFGSVLAALLPLASAIIAVFTALGALGTLATAITFGTVSPTLATMMGLGVGIDYALFIGTRFRQALIDGREPDEAIEVAVTTSGRAVIIAACTVVIAMLGLYVSGISFIGKLGLAAGIGVAFSALAALTLVPALLGIAGAHIDRLRVRRPIAEPTSGQSPMHRYAERLARHPWPFALGGITVLLGLAVPVLSINLGHIGAGSQPRSYSERRAYDAISAGFGAGANGPLTIVVQTANGVRPSQRSALAQALPAAIRPVSDVSRVTAFSPSQDGAILVGHVIPRTGPSAAATNTLVTTLQDTTLPATLQAHSGARQAEVSGTTAVQLDFQRDVSSRIPLIIAVVLAAAFVLLLGTFRAPVLALKAALLNLLSIGAALGVVVAVFQKGWGGTALGLTGKVPIESYVPMMLFAIVFGLSMDYEVFLLSRVREHWLQTDDSEASVVRGLSETARVIACAATIMACVFLAFLLSTNIIVKMLALGLGISVIVDATIIRLLIVPSVMFLLGRACWWCPAWLRPAGPAPAEPALGPPTPEGATGSG